jgi:hypothetical protein
MKRKKKKRVIVPMDLARLLTAEPKDLKDPSKHDEVHNLARSLLRLLMKATS